MDKQLEIDVNNLIQLAKKTNEINEEDIANKLVKHELTPEIMAGIISLFEDEGIKVVPAEDVVVKDEEYGPYIWRVMMMAKDESLLSDTINIEDDIDLGRISREIKWVIYDTKKNLNIGKYNDFINDDEKEMIDLDIKNILSKFKQFFNDDEI